MIARRQGEKGDVPFRSGRFFSVGVEWYAATREGPDLGPFASQDEAKIAVQDYIERLASSHSEAEGSAPNEDAIRAEVRVEELRQFMKRRDAQGLTAARLWAKDRIKRLQGEPMPFAERHERLSVLRYLLSRE